MIKVDIDMPEKCVQLYRRENMERVSKLEEIVARLREELMELPANTIEYNMGYAAAIRDLEHIVAEEQAERSADNGKSE